MDESKTLYKEFLKEKKEAFDQIMDLYAENSVYFIQRYVRNVDVAQDIAQDVFVYILLHKEKYNFKYSLKTYLYTIGKTRALNYLKREKRIVELKEDMVYDVDNELEEFIFKDENKRNLKQAMNKLSREYQIIIYLADIEELKYKDTCKILNKTLSQVKMMIYRARKKLKEILSKEGEDFYE